MKLFFYVLLMLLLLPVFLLGFFFYMVPILLSRGKISGTAYEPFNGRLLYHLWGSRHDAAALQRAGGLPATNHVSMSLFVRPIVWASRITDYLPGFLDYPPPRPTPISAMIGARCEFLDKVILDRISMRPSGYSWGRLGYTCLRIAQGQKGDDLRSRCPCHTGG
jgi:hypothetical protein